jgi:hypothetical protein
VTSTSVEAEEVPIGPVQLMVNVEEPVLVGKKTKVPLVGSGPLQAPEPTHVVAPGADHASVTLSPSS